MSSLCRPFSPKNGGCFFLRTFFCWSFHEIQGTRDQLVHNQLHQPSPGFNPTLSQTHRLEYCRSCLTQVALFMTACLVLLTNIALLFFFNYTVYLLCDLLQTITQKQTGHSCKRVLKEESTLFIIRLSCVRIYQENFHQWIVAISASYSVVVQSALTTVYYN